MSSTVKSQEQDSIPSLELEAVYSSLPWFNVNGGLKTDFVYMDNLDLTAKLNFDKIFNFEDRLSIFIYGLRNSGTPASDLMGDFQIASNIEAIKSWRLFELFIQHNFNKQRFSILAGLYDLNSEFDVLRPGTLFINSSFGIGAEYAQSGENGPSIFPVSSLGVRFAAILGKRSKIRIAVLDGIPGETRNLRSNAIRLSGEDGALIAAEVSLYRESTADNNSRKINRSYEARRQKVGREFEVPNNDKINIGAWYYTNEFREIDDSLTFSKGNLGIYFGFQKYIPLDRDSEFISLFGRIGLANPKFNRLGSAFSGGIVLSNPWTEWEDIFGLAFSSAVNGRNFLKANDNSELAETAFEFTYSLPITSWLLVQPDVQYILNPSTQVDLTNALSFAVLIQVLIKR